MFIFERQRDSASGRERRRQNVKPAPDSELSAQSPMWGSSPHTVRS